MAQSTKQQGKRKRTKRKKTSLPPVVVVLGILVALMASLFLLCLLFFIPKSMRAPEASSAETPILSFGSLGKKKKAAKAKPETGAEPAEQIIEDEDSMPPSELVAECFGTENGYKTYNSETLSADLGVDVSSYQGWIDWQAVAQSGVDYAILRAGYRGYTHGDTKADDYFSYNLEAATAAGLDVGVYYFSQALTEEEAVAEAQQVLSMVEGYELSYPIYFDWETVEDSNARTDTISSTELTACALAFCETIENAGYRAGVYFNLSTAFQLYHLGELLDYEFWLAEYRDTPTYPFKIHMWQYTDVGKVPGINANVDLNLSFR